MGLSMATLISQRHSVVAMDIVPEKVEMINQRRSPIQDEYIERYFAEKTLDLTGLAGKYRDRRIDDNTFINFADLILLNLENSTENIGKIRRSLTLLKDSQAVFTNLEKLYLYRYVFTKGVEADYKIELCDRDQIEDPDVRIYLERALADKTNADYADITFYEDTLLWIGREYQKRYIRYVEISDTTLVKKDVSAARMLGQLHHILPLVKKETGVDIRFLAAIRRIPLTLVKDNIASTNYLTEAIQALKVVCKDPYVVGSDFVGEEINDIEELKSVIYEIVRSIVITMEKRIREKNIVIDFKYEKSENIVEADESAIYRVVQNLLDNALKFASIGSEIEISITNKNGFAVFSIKNYGSSISEEEQKYIWDRYYKADSSRSYHKKGTGLGLYIVKSIINQHNQEIEIKSDDNSVEFSFTLNLTNC